MKTTPATYLGILAVGIAVLVTVGQARLDAQPITEPAIRIGRQRREGAGSRRLGDRGMNLRAVMAPSAAAAAEFYPAIYWYSMLKVPDKSAFPGTGPGGNGGRFDARRVLTLFVDSTDRLAAGELPAAQPSRPQGVERNLVVTL
jgi:hypothetical protein